MEFSVLKEVVKMPDGLPEEEVTVMNNVFEQRQIDFEQQKTHSKKQASKPKPFDYGSRLHLS
jgi:hypothetical protein